MNVSALEEYGLRCAVRLASAYAPLDDLSTEKKQTLSAPEIAELEGLSVEYVSKFMLHLKKAGLVNTVRGINGGFALTRAPSEISLKDVFDALGGKRRVPDSASGDFCKSYAGKSDTCVRNDSCTIRPFWNVMSLYIEAFTRELSLQDLLRSESETRIKTEAIARRNAEQLKL